MQDRPDLRELIESVADFLGREVVAAAADPRLRFRARVAQNVLAIAGRELELGDALAMEECERLRALFGEPAADEAGSVGASELAARVRALTGRLARDIRDGRRRVAPGDDVWRHVRATVEEKLRIANPEYLRRVMRR